MCSSRGEFVFERFVFIDEPGEGRFFFERREGRILIFEERPVEGPRFVGRTVTVSNEVKEDEEIFKGEFRLVGGELC